MIEQPDLRIVPQELWELVQERNRRMRKIGRQRLGGFNKTKQSEGYLFSGLFRVWRLRRRNGHYQKREDPPPIGCRKHQFKARCSNAIAIRRDALEEQLLHAIAEKLRPDVLDITCAAYRSSLQITSKKRLQMTLSLM